MYALNGRHPTESLQEKDTSLKWDASKKNVSNYKQAKKIHMYKMPKNRPTVPKILHDCIAKT